MSEITLKEYIDTRIKSVEDKLDAQADFGRLQARLTAEAVKKAEESMNLRMANTNEWRDQSKDREATFAQKESVAAIAENIDNRLKKLENSNSFTAGKLWMVMAVFASIPTILALIALWRG